MNVFKMLLLCLAVVVPLSCGDDDTGTPDVTHDADVGADADADADADGDVTEETDSGCPANDATHLYISIGGMVRPLGGTAVAGVRVQAVEPVSVLSGTPSIVGSAVSGADGSWRINCINVQSVLLGLVAETDDDPADGVGGTFFPTFTGIISWTVEGKVDKFDGLAFTLTNEFRTGLATLTGVDPVANGLVMGVVVDGTSLAPLTGATVGCAGTGCAPLTVVYPNADFTGLMSPAATSANGTWVLTDVLATLTDMTATLAGYTFPTFPAAQVPGTCYFLPFPSE